MHHVIAAIGFLASLAGLALMVRFGFRYQSRLEFSGTMPTADHAHPDFLRQHNDDVKGRFGFGLVVIGVLVLTVATYCS